MNSETKIGSHRLVREADDILAVYFAATPTEGEMMALIDAQVDMSAGAPTFLLLDFTHVESLPAPVRRAVGEGTKRMNYKAVGGFGASFHIKVVAKLINNAIALFKKNTFPQDFFDDRAATLAWFDHLRRLNAGGGAA